MNITYFTDQGYKIRGIIHVGTHGGEEMDLYNTLDIKYVLGFEPIPKWCDIANEKYKGHCHQLALSDHNGEADFYVTKDGALGQCSSLFEPINFVGGRIDGIDEIIKVQVGRFDDWSFGHLTDEERKDYNALVIDTQGSEFEVLKGFGDYLDDIDFLVCEMSAEPLYKGGSPAQTVSNWLEQKGFIRLTPIEDHDDVLFIRDGVKP